MRKKLLFLVIIFILAIPTFSRMLRPGIFSMQDFHYFRLVEFTKCVSDFQIPCRWAADSGAGFGEPIFNFYGQLPYVPGAIGFIVGLSKIDSLKITFIFSLVLSAFSMFFLARKIWKNDLAAVLSSIVYLYAPYRAVDVWVRGALPEAISFVFFPLIILAVENYLTTFRKKYLLFFSLLLGLLIINHNLSVVLLAPFLIVWVIFRFIEIKKIKLFIHLALASLFSIFLAAFYLLPLVFESKFISIDSTTSGIYDWRANFVTIYQIFVSRFWGYGGSTWGNEDGLSLAIGFMQWLIPIIVILLIFLRRKITKDTVIFAVLIFIGVIGLFLTHNKSTFIWDNLSFMKYIQFPWRFLATSVFALSLASGFFIKLLEKTKVQTVASLGIIFVVIVLNFNYFRPDIWYNLNDRDLESGERWKEATFSSLADYWPIYGSLPTSEAYVETDDIKLISKKSNLQTFEVKTFGKEVEFPVAYFPGWEVKYEGRKVITTFGEKGLISAFVVKGEGNDVTLEFKNTSVRIVGNLISLVTVGVWAMFFVKFKNADIK